MAGEILTPTIQTEIDRIATNITMAFNACSEKGVAVPGGVTSDALASIIASIEAGGGGAKFETGTWTNATQHSGSGTVSIPHSLGVEPSFVALVLANDDSYYITVSDANYLIYAAQKDVYSFEFASSSANRGFMYAPLGHSKYRWGSTDSTIGFSIGKIGNYGPIMQAGATYRWVAVAGEA